MKRKVESTKVFFVIATAVPYNQITTDAFLMCEKSPLGKSTLSSLKTRTKRRPTTALVPQMYSQYNAFGQNDYHGKLYSFLTRTYFGQSDWITQSVKNSTYLLPLVYLLLQLIWLRLTKNVEEVLCQAVISRNIRWLFFANYIFQPVQGDQGRECIVITVLEQGQNIRKVLCTWIQTIFYYNRMKCFFIHILSQKVEKYICLYFWIHHRTFLFNIDSYL